MNKRNFFKLIPAAHIIVRNKKGQVLLLRRFNTGYEDGNYSVPAGHLDGDENASEAAIRELREETGLEANLPDLKFSHVMHRLRKEENEERVDFFFAIDDWQGEPKITEPDKSDKLIWAFPDNLPENIVDYIQFYLEKMLDKKSYSEFGW